MEELNEMEIQLIHEGERIAAIRSYRNRTGATLKSAKELTEKIVPMSYHVYDEEDAAVALRCKANQKRKEKQTDKHILQEVLDWVDREMVVIMTRIGEVKEAHQKALDHDKKIELHYAAAKLNEARGHFHGLHDVKKMLTVKMKEVE